MAALLKIKTLLNLVISDLLRFIFACLLFIAIVATVLVALSHRQSFSAILDYLVSLDTNATAIFLPTTTSTPAVDTSDGQ